MRTDRVVYVDPGAPRAEVAPALRSGEAGYVWLGAEGVLETDVRVALSFNTTHALIGHGVVDALNELALEGRVGGGLEAVVPAAVLDAARAIFVDADRMSYGAVHEFVVASCAAPEPTEYRIRIDNREYQASLARLAFLTSSASREGKAVWICI